MADGLLSGAPKPMGGLLGFLGDPDRRARLAMALEGMTLNPNQAFIQSLGEGIKTRADKAETEKTRNATAQWLRSQGREDLAAAVESGAVDGSAAATAAMQRPDPVRGVGVGNQLVNPVTGEVIYTAPQSAPDPVRGVGVGNQLVNPVTGEVIYTAPEGAGGMNSARVQELQWRAREAGLQPGTPEYQQFILSGGGGIGDAQPAAFVALDLQAKAAGFQPGTTEYRDFMATRGAGLIAEAKSRGDIKGEAAGQMPAASSMTDMITEQITSLSNDPYLDQMLGPVQSRLPNVTGEAARVQSKLDQLQGGAFLQARQMLKGGGAITDFESTRAEAAFARLAVAQDPKDFRDALSEFDEAVRDGLKKLQATASMSSSVTGGQPSGGAPVTGQPSDDDLLRMYGGE